MYMQILVTGKCLSCMHVTRNNTMKRSRSTAALSPSSPTTSSSIINLSSTSPLHANSPRVSLSSSCSPFAAKSLTSASSSPPPRKKPRKTLASSTLPAIQKLSLLSYHHKMLPPIVLSHLLYTMPNRSQIDRDLDHLRADGRILLVQLREWNIQGKDPLGIVLFDQWEKALKDQLTHYIRKKDQMQSQRSSIAARYRKFKKSNHSAKYTRVLNAFINFVKRSSTENYIMLDELHGEPIKADDDDTLMLTRIGAIAHRDSDSYHLNSPHIGWFLTELRKGRRELLLMLKNAKYKELTRDRTLQRQLKRSELKMELLIRDCVALDYVKERDLPDGSELLSITPTGLKYLSHDIQK